MSKVECKCDPLYKLMESCVREILGKGRERCGEGCAVASSEEERINHNRLGTHHIGDEDFSHVSHASVESNVNLLLSKFRERCIRTHTPNILRNMSKYSVSLSFPHQFFTRLRTLWRSLLEEDERKILAQMDMNPLFSHAEGRILLEDIQERVRGDLVVDSVRTTGERFSIVHINLSVPSVSKAVIKWILENYPRPVKSSGCCRLEHCSVSVGATELPTDLSANMPILLYRKYLIARSLLIALGKSGYFVDPNQFYVLPNEPEYTRSIIVVSEGRDGTKTVQRIRMGLVAVREMTARGTKSYRDISAEHFHNLRLQSVKIMRESNFEDKSASDVDLSWIISAANLTAATMNYDLLMKDASADIELLASERKDTSFNNAGMLLIMYNYARIISILKKYSSMVIKKDYPPLPSVEIVDFGLLASEEEISLVQLVWQWPRIVERTVDFLEHSLNISFLLKSVKELANRFNSFYTSNMVLGPPNAPHNFNKMFARMYLLQAIRLVFEEFLEIMQINFNSENFSYDWE